MRIQNTRMLVTHPMNDNLNTKDQYIYVARQSSTTEPLHKSNNTVSKELNLYL